MKKKITNFRRFCVKEPVIPKKKKSPAKSATSTVARVHSIPFHPVRTPPRTLVARAASCVFSPTVFPSQVSQGFQHNNSLGPKDDLPKNGNRAFLVNRPGTHVRVITLPARVSYAPLRYTSDTAPSPNPISQPGLLRFEHFPSLSSPDHSSPHSLLCGGIALVTLAGGKTQTHQVLSCTWYVKHVYHMSACREGR